MLYILINKMVIGVGIDLVQNSRIRKALGTYKISFLKKILTNEELDEIGNKKISIRHLAGIFAAKEAVIKSLSSFLGFSLSFQEIIFKKGPTSIPIVIIINQKAKIKLADIKLAISISHEKYYSIALSIAEII